MGALHQQFDLICADAARAAREALGERLLAFAVFGSVGRGTPRFDSDIDALVVLADSVRLTHAGRLGVANQLVASCQSAVAQFAAEGVTPELSPVIRSAAELSAGFPLLLDMVDDARILHDPKALLHARLELLRQRLQAAGARRHWSANGWHWDLGGGDFQP